MLPDKNNKGDQNNFIKTIAIIMAIAISTFYIMIWISPESKNVGQFLFGFGIAFVGIVLSAYFIKYINDLYKQIKNRK